MLPRLANSVKNEKRGFKPDVQIRGNSHVSSRELRKKRCVFEGVANDAVALFCLSCFLLHCCCLIHLLSCVSLLFEVTLPASRFMLLRFHSFLIFFVDSRFWLMHFEFSPSWNDLQFYLHACLPWFLCLIFSGSLLDFNSFLCWFSPFVPFLFPEPACLIQTPTCQIRSSFLSSWSVLFLPVTLRLYWWLCSISWSSYQQQQHHVATTRSICPRLFLGQQLRQRFIVDASSILCACQKKLSQPMGPCRFCQPPGVDCTSAGPPSLAVGESGSSTVPPGW